MCFTHPAGTTAEDDNDSTGIVALSSGDPESDGFKCTLYRLRNKQATIALHHIHKCGGTSLCRALVLSNSSLMGCRPEDAGKVVVHPFNEECNCNGHASTLPSPFSLGVGEVEQLLARHKQQPPAAFFNEDGLANPAWFGPGAVQMVVLRNPVDRRASSSRHECICLALYQRSCCGCTTLRRHAAQSIHGGLVGLESAVQVAPTVLAMFSHDNLCKSSSMHIYGQLATQHVLSRSMYLGTC
jgi:hypothetical protein